MPSAKARKSLSTSRTLIANSTPGLSTPGLPLAASVGVITSEAEPRLRSSYNPRLQDGLRGEGRSNTFSQPRTTEMRSQFFADVVIRAVGASGHPIDFVRNQGPGCPKLCQHV